VTARARGARLRSGTRPPILGGHSARDDTRAKQLKCGDLMSGCDFAARGANEDEVLKKTAEHAQKAHSIVQVTPELAAK